MKKNKFTEQEIINLLNNRKFFNNSKEMCEYLGFEYNTHTHLNLRSLSEYCEWHKETMYKIIIDKVYEKRIVKKNKNYDFIYNINDIVETKYGKILILDRYKKQWSENDKHKHKTYLCKCLEHNYEFELRENHINQGIGCPICGGRKPILGYSTIYDLRPDLLKYIVNEDDAKNNTLHSNKKILCKCPFCGRQKYVRILNLTRVGFSCNFCSDHISYPNKFLRELFKQLNLNFNCEKTFNWSDNKLYDFYIIDDDIIVEAHGIQHYEERNFSKIGGRTLKEEQENDKLKEKIAHENDIKHYIVIDCRKSQLEWIKNSVMNSKLPELLNFKEEDIDWMSCHENCLKTIIKEVCEYWDKSKIKTITEISNHFNMDVHTISEYLEKGSKLGWCEYEKNNKYYRYKAVSMAKSKPIYCYELDIYFRTRNECESYFRTYLNDQKFNGKYLYHYINDNKKYHNYTFCYLTLEKYNEILTKQNNIYELIIKEKNLK